MKETRINDLVEFFKESIEVVTRNTYDRFINGLEEIYEEFNFKVMLLDIDFKFHSRLLIYDKHKLICILKLFKDFTLAETIISIDGIDLAPYIDKKDRLYSETIKYVKVDYLYEDKTKSLTIKEKLDMLDQFTNKNK